MAMRKEIEQSIANVQTILLRSGLTGAEKDVILTELSKALYDKCTGNAMLFAFNDYFKELCPEKYNEYIGTFRTSETFNFAFRDRMKQIWPYEERY